MLINAASQELRQPRPGGNFVPGARSATEGRRDLPGQTVAFIYVPVIQKPHRGEIFK